MRGKREFNTIRFTERSELVERDRDIIDLNLLLLIFRTERDSLTETTPESP